MTENREGCDFFSANFLTFKSHIDEFEKLKKTLSEYENYD